MGKTFEDEFTELQIGLMELCLEFAEGRADRIFVFAKICKSHYSIRFLNGMAAFCFHLKWQIMTLNL